VSKKISNPTKTGNIIIVSAPSGAGKSSICEAVVASDEKNIIYSVSYTTRPPRKGEKNGRDYFFVDEKSFKMMVEKGKFAEWARVHGSYYGTSQELIDKVLDAGKDVLLEIDVHGGINIKKQYPDKTCMIFIMAPDFKTLEERLIARNKDCKEAIDTRMANAKKELGYLPEYDYLIINRNLNDAVESVKIIIKSLKYKVQKNITYFS
jgi:guanylate kinase